MKWIRITDGCELPAEGQAVLVTAKDGDSARWTVACRFGCELWEDMTLRDRDGDYILIEDKVTHYLVSAPPAASQGPGEPAQEG